MNLLTCSKQQRTVLTSSGKFRQFLTPQILKVMKLTFILMTAFFLQVSATGLSQNVTISFKNVSLEKVFKEIEHQTGIGFLYPKRMLRDAEKVTINVKDVPVDVAIKQCLKDQSFDFKMQNNTILITKKAVSAFANQISLSTMPLAPTIDIHGKVVDEKGNPLNGVSVTVKGNKKGTSTNEKGEFSLNSVDENSTIIISFVGYQIKELKAKNVSGVITLSQQVSKLDEINVTVSTGYGTLKRKDLTDAVTSLNPKILESTNMISVGNLIQGQLAGVNVLVGSSAPGAPVRIRIRGDATINDGADPLIVVDGVPMPDDYNLNDINPNDIATIDILKGASSAAIYGSRASAGVMEIRTKRGSQYTKPQITYSYNYGQQSLEKKIHSLNADQFKSMFSEGLVNYIRGTFDVRADADSIKKWVRPSNNRNYYDFYTDNKFDVSNTDWVGLMIKPANTQDHYISLRGGDKKTQYSFSYGKNLENGMLAGSNYDRNTISMNYDQNFSNNLKVGFSGMGGFSETNGTVSIGTATTMRPDAAAYNPDGSYHIFHYTYAGSVSQVDNPLILANDVTNKTIGKVLSVSPYAELKFWRDFKFTSRYNYNLNIGTQRQYYPSTTRAGQNYSTAKGRLIDTRSQGSSSTFTNYLTYFKTIKNHDIIAVLGTELNKSKTQYVTERYLNFADDRIQNAVWQAATYQWADGNESETEAIGYYGRLNYKFKNRYLLTSSFRVDGSSRFAPKNRFGFFPAVSAAYIMSDEPFFAKIKNTLSLLKIRASVGKTGNDRVGPYSWLAQYQSGVSYMNLPGVRPTDLGNDNLKWEASTEYNLGVDFGFLNNSRIRGSLDIYKKDVTNMLIAIPMAPSTGVTSVYQNFGDLTNKGVELSLSAVVVEQKNFSWELGMNISKNSNVLTRLGIDRASTTSGQTWLSYYVIQEGQPLGLVYGYKTDGLFKNYKEIDQYEALNPAHRYQESNYSIPGDIKFVDASGDGYISAGTGKDNDPHEDRRIIGKTQPDFWGGFNTTLQYKELRLDITGTFQKGGVKYWKYAETQFQMNNIAPNNVDAIALERWTPENPNGKYPAFRNQYYTNKINDFWLYDASFLKIQEISLSYNLPKKLLAKTKVISGINVYASLHNVYTFTKYPGYNVESFSSNPLEGSMMDNSSYPNERNFRIGARVMF